MFSVLVLALSLGKPAFGQFKNTPFDPKTWKKTIDNTPFDPKTWKDTADGLTNPAGLAMERYAADLHSKYRTNRGLSHTEKYYLRPWFGDIVDKVTVFWGAKLNSAIKVGGKTVAVASSAQTFGYRIYIKERRKTGDSQQMVLLAHELLHTWQFERYGKSLRKFSRAYMNGYFKSGGNYADNPLERYAFDFEIRYAQWLGKNFPNSKSGSIVYRTGSPNQKRTAIIPQKLVIPPQEYALTCIENRTRLKLTYLIRWGNGKSERVEVQPGKRMIHSWAYPGGMKSSPNLAISFDESLAKGLTKRSYTLKRKRSRSKDCRGAQSYYFAIKDRKLVLFAAK